MLLASVQFIIAIGELNLEEVNRWIKFFYLSEKLRIINVKVSQTVFKEG